ncbi:hypothetical protein BJX65DRAFT_139444 [Aspergillus insuetus]
MIVGIPGYIDLSIAIFYCMVYLIVHVVALVSLLPSCRPSRCSRFCGWARVIS